MKEQISTKRAGEIALAIIRHTWSNRGINLSQEEFDGKLNRLEKQAGIRKLYLGYFFAEELLARTFEKCAGVLITVQVHFTRGISNDYHADAIAIALLRADGIDFRPDQFQPRLKRLTEITDIPLLELENFYLQEIIPHALTAATGKDCKVVVSERPPLPDIGQPQ